MQKLQGFNAYSAFYWTDMSLDGKRKNWAALEDKEKRRWERMAEWINRYADEARSEGYEQGERSGVSRAWYRPGDGDMGG